MAWNVQEDSNVGIDCFYILMLLYTQSYSSRVGYNWIFQGSCGELLLEKHTGFVGQDEHGYMEHESWLSFRLFA